MHVAVDATEVKFAAFVLIELEESFFLFIDIVVIPRRHGSDAPTARERRRDF